MNQQLPGLETDALDLLDQIVGCAAAFAAITEDDDPEYTVQDIPEVLGQLSKLAHAAALTLDSEYKPTLMGKPGTPKTEWVPGNATAIIECGASPFFNPTTWYSRGYRFHKQSQKGR